MTKPKALKPLVVKGKKEEKPIFQTYCLVKKDRLWHVMTLDIQESKVIGKHVSVGDARPVTVNRLIQKIAAGIRYEDTKQRRELRQ